MLLEDINIYKYIKPFTGLKSSYRVIIGIKFACLTLTDRSKVILQDIFCDIRDFLSINLDQIVPCLSLCHLYY